MKQVYPTFILNTNDGSEHSFLVCVPDMEIFKETEWKCRVLRIGHY